MTLSQDQIVFAIIYAVVGARLTWDAVEYYETAKYVDMKINMALLFAMLLAAAPMTNLFALMSQ